MTATSGCQATIRSAPPRGVPTTIEQKRGTTRAVGLHRARSAVSAGTRGRGSGKVLSISTASKREWRERCVPSSPRPTRSPRLRHIGSFANEVDATRAVKSADGPASSFASYAQGATLASAGASAGAGASTSYVGTSTSYPTGSVAGEARRGRTSRFRGGTWCRVGVGSAAAASAWRRRCRLSPCGGGGYRGVVVCRRRRLPSVVVTTTATPAHP